MLLVKRAFNFTNSPYRPCSQRQMMGRPYDYDQGVIIPYRYSCMIHVIYYYCGMFNLSTTSILCLPQTSYHIIMAYSGKILENQQI